MGSKHSQRVWQPMLAMGLKENFVLQNTRKIVGRWVFGVNSKANCFGIL